MADSFDDARTEQRRPIPPRPYWGWFAWEATVGYIHDEYNPDVMLTLTMTPAQEIVMWNARLNWGEQGEEVRDRLGFAMVLADLWKQVAAHHNIYKSLEAAVKRPENYEDDRWVDAATLEALTRLIGVTSTVFGSGWWLMVSYRPIEMPNSRTMARLVVEEHGIARGGHGATLRDACRNLYHNATPLYKQFSNKESF